MTMPDHGALAIPTAALAAAAAAFAVCIALVPLAIGAGTRWKLLDEPDERKHHAGAVPRTGGIAVMGGLAAGSCVAWALGALPAAAGSLVALPVIVATAIVFAVGLWDDARGCSVGVKLAVESIAAALIVGAGHGIEVVSTPVGSYALGSAAGSALAVVWLVGITNAINLMDGFDGLSGGIASIVAASLAAFSVLQGNPTTTAVALVVCGACAAFLPWNWQPARIFLGDGGALAIGFVLAWLALAASIKATTAVAVFVPALVLGLPAFDTLLVMGVRFMESPSRGFLARTRDVVRADRRHLHHRLLAVTGQRNVVMTVYALVGVFCLLSLLAVVRNSLRLAAATLLVEIVVVIVVHGMGARAARAGGAASAGRRPVIQP